MATYLHPGVYIEEIPSGSKPIEAASTSVTAFIGRAQRGPVGKANLIHSRDDYVTDYGPITHRDDAMGLAVQAFYLNGGKDAYICRLANSGPPTASSSATVLGQNTGNNPVIQIEATSPGEWGNAVYFQIVKPDRDAMSFNLLVGRKGVGEKFEATETYTRLTMNSSDANYLLARVNGNSRDIRIALRPPADPTNAAAYPKGILTGGTLSAANNLFHAAAPAGLADPMSMSLNINGLGTKQITVARPTLAGTSNQTDGDAVADAIINAVKGLGTGDEYQKFDCTYANQRFTLKSGTTGPASSVIVSGGDLAKFLRLDASAKAERIGGAVGADIAAIRLALKPPNVKEVDLTLNIDGYGDQLIKVATATIDDVNKTKALETLASAIQKSVRELSLAIPSYAEFICTYDSGTREFTLTSGGSSVRSSSLAATSGAVVDLMDLLHANAVMNAGRELTPGAARVTPVETLGSQVGDVRTGVALTGGGEAPPTTADYAGFLGNVLRKVRDVSIIVLPGLGWTSNGERAKISQVLAHCEATKNRMLIIDPPPGQELPDAKVVDDLGLPTSTYAVLYYPWVEVANPLYDADKHPEEPRRLTIAPSGFAAGMWSKIDGKRGVWKAPAGTETNLLGPAGLRFDVEDGEQDQLNPLGINCIRKLPVFGTVIWGSRTLSTNADPEWRYVPVRRTAIFIESSIFKGIQWAVFEPNDIPLWSALRANIDTFMNGLFRAGAFQGGKASDAYFVRCGKGDTMTQGDIDAGQVIVIVGFAPLKPAEFVIVRIQQKVGQQ